MTRPLSRQRPEASHSAIDSFPPKEALDPRPSHPCVLLQAGVRPVLSQTCLAWINASFYVFAIISPLTPDAIIYSMHSPDWRVAFGSLLDPP